MVVSTSLRTLSTVGMCVNGSFLGICTWRLIKTFQAMDSVKEKRVRLHLTLFTFALFEFVYQVSIYVMNDVAVWGYIFHILALTTYIISFCSIFIRWERTLGLARGERVKVGRVAGFIVAVNAVFNLLFIILILIDSDYIGGEGHLWPLKFARDIVECISLLFSTVWLFAYSVHLNDRLSRIQENTTSSSFSSQGRKQRSVKRIVVVLFVCSVSYISRLVCLAILAVDTATNSTRAQRFDMVGWFLLSNWIPTLIPGLLFLYTSRMIKVDEVKNSKTLQDVFKNDFISEYSDDDETAANPIHSTSTDQPSVNIDGVDRPSTDFQADMRNRGSVESLPPGHSMVVEEEGDYFEENDGIYMTQSIGAIRPSEYPEEVIPEDIMQNL